MHLSRRPSRSPDSKLPGITVRFCTTRLDGRGAFRAIFEMVQTLRWPNESRNPPSRLNRDRGSGQIPKSRQNRDRGKIRRIFPIPAKIGHIGIQSEKISLFLTARTVIADCQRQARLVRFLGGVPGWEKRLIAELLGVGTGSDRRLDVLRASPNSCEAW